MADSTKIQWADATFNPWIGCTKVSAGCANCYAENTTRARVLRSQGHETWGRGAKRSRTSAATWRKPILWNEAVGDDRLKYAEQAARAGHSHLTRNLRAFPSLCDWLDNEVPIEWLADFLKLIFDTPKIDWLLLTKRPELWREQLNSVALMDRTPGVRGSNFRNWVSDWFTHEKYPENIWFGVSCENQAMADKRIPELVKIPAKIRFLSVEPMLGLVDFKKHIPRFAPAHGKPFFDGIDWVIFGGESGSGARPCNIGWIRNGVEQCRITGVAPFVKQLGAMPFMNGVSGLGSSDGNQYVHKLELNDKKGGDMSEWPEGLRIREFPIK